MPGLFTNSFDMEVVVVHSFRIISSKIKLGTHVALIVIIFFVIEMKINK